MLLWAFGARHTPSVEFPLVLPVLLLVQALPVAVAVVPPVVMGVRRGWSVTGVVLWVLALGLLVAWSAAASADMDRADTTGGTGSILAGFGWLLTAGAVAAGSVATVRRDTRRPGVTGS